MTTSRSGTRTPPRAPRSARRVGYAALIGVNIVAFWIVHNLLDWGWPPFLTSDFEQLLWLIDISIAVNVLFSVIYMWFDPTWFQSAAQVVVNAIGLILSIRTLQVFPFDFSPYDFNWGALARGILIVAIVGSSIGIITELVKLARAAGGDANR